MLAQINTRIPASEGRRAEVLSVVFGACDLCGARCEESRQYDGWSDFSQSLAHLVALSAGYKERYAGERKNLLQLICPTCAAML